MYLEVWNVRLWDIYTDLYRFEFLSLYLSTSLSLSFSLYLNFSKTPLSLSIRTWLSFRPDSRNLIQYSVKFCQILKVSNTLSSLVFENSQVTNDVSLVYKFTHSWNAFQEKKLNIKIHYHAKTIRITSTNTILSHFLPTSNTIYLLLKLWTVDKQSSVNLSTKA